MSSWLDDGLKLIIEASTAGDFVKLGTATEYPFVAGGSGYPTGWNQWLSNSAGPPPGLATDVSWTTSYGRFSIGNIGTDVHSPKLYGIYRDFPTTPGKRYLVQVQARTTDGRSSAIRYVKFGNLSATVYYSQVWTYDDWEQVSLYTGVWGYTTLRVWLYAAPYDAAGSGHAPADANWGIQFQNVTIIEQEASYPTPTWKEITCDIHNLTTHYGRDKFLNRYDVATAQIDLFNNDGEYMYGLSDWLRPGRFIRIRIQKPTGNPWSHYYGIIDSVSNGFTLDGRAVVTLACIDTSSLLSNMTVPTYSDQFDTFLSGARFRNLLFASGWHPQFEFNDPGLYTQQAILANGRSVRDELGLIADSEGGMFYCNRTGVLEYRDRSFYAASPTINTVQAELLATPYKTNLPLTDGVPNDANMEIIPLRSISTEWSRDRVINTVTMANQGGTAIITQNYDSQTKYGPRTYQRLDLLNDNTHPEYLTERTSDVMTGYTDAILRVNSVSFVPSPINDAWQFAIVAFLGHMVRVRYEHPTEGWGFAVVSYIQGITHSFTTHEWTVTLTLDQPRAFNFWRSSDTGWDIATWDVVLWDEFGNEAAYWNSGEKWNDPNTRWGPDPGFGASQWDSKDFWSNANSHWGT